MPNITVNRHWSIYSVSHTCVKHGLYTGGTNKEYENMCLRVDGLSPDPENIYSIAEDIQKHSVNQTITNIMFLLERDAVATTFEIDGRDDI